MVAIKEYIHDAFLDWAKRFGDVFRITMWTPQRSIDIIVTTNVKGAVSATRERLLEEISIGVVTHDYDTLNLVSGTLQMSSTFSETR